MKKSLLALAVLGAFAGAASAQSSLTVFGIVDLSVNNVKNGTVSQKFMGSNQLNSNRLGFRGTEDLGGGMNASFWIEGGMSNDDGTPGGLNFQRRSTVSLSGGFGEVRLGRDYVNTFSNVASFDAYGANGFGNFSNIYATAPAGMGAGATTAVRANNMVGYFLPGKLGGLYGSVQMSAGENVAGNKYTGFRLGYAAGPVDVAAAMSQTDVGNPNKYKVFNVGASYNMGFAKILAQYDQRKFGVLKYTSYQLSTNVPLGQGEFRASFAKGNAEGGLTKNNDATLLGLEYIYNLSKRTALYTQYGRLNNKGTSAISLGGSVTGAGTGFTSTGYGAGVRHIF
ncbi:porin [Aquabacterium sp. OR-4]|uniref:porin n=1 Tax=Aquabacterium sp. OR-4 TaxID=2978127 RepID=UPI0021B395C7|nr:porin [Aquabacterium sp. OR-4]MDT7837585.1 porin [Aquabacterium sp. OR-4]